SSANAGSDSGSDSAGGSEAGSGGGRAAPTELHADRTATAPPDAPFVAGEIADRGPLERGSVPAPEPRARDVRELSRHPARRGSARVAIETMRADEGTGPVNAEALTGDDPELEARLEAVRTDGEEGDGVFRLPDRDSLPTLRVLPQGISRKRLE